MSYTAKSVILDIADKFTPASFSYMILRSVEFHFESSLIPMTTGFSAYATTEFATPTYQAENAFNTSLSKTGTIDNTTWASSAISNQRLIIVFDTAITFDEIIYNNGHHGGLRTEAGCKTVKINISSDAITSTVYDEAIANSDLIFDGVFIQHVASDVADDQSPTLIPPWDGTVDSPEIIITSSVSSDLQHDVSQPEIILTSDVGGGLFTGAIIDSPEIITTTGGDSDVQIDIDSPEIVTTSGGDSDVRIDIDSPEIILTSDTLLGGIFVGVPLTTPEIVLTSGGDSDLSMGIIPPEIVMTTAADSDVRIGIDSPEIINTVNTSIDDITSFQIEIGATQYSLVITGDGSTTEDVIIPFTSVQARQRKGDSTYLQVVVPGIDYADAITDRVDNKMQVFMGYISNVQSHGRMMIETDIEQVNIYQGPTNKSIVLIGYATNTYTQQTIYLEKPIYKALVDGVKTYRFATPNINLQPGDIVKIGDDTITAGVITWNISNSNSGPINTMEITAGDPEAPEPEPSPTLAWYPYTVVEWVRRNTDGTWTSGPSHIEYYQWYA